MLKENPRIGQFVKVLVSEAWKDSGEQYQTKGDIYEVVGISDISGNPYFIGDLDEPIFIDDAAFDLYEIYEESDDSKPKVAVSIALTGADISAWEYKETATEFSFKFKMQGESSNTLKAIDSLQEDIIELLNRKY